mgnify:FL=1|tara:strand:+ start:118 stop:291 length:174 start_codon:yes stop_codon:yes gene_type:complete
MLDFFLKYFRSDLPPKDQKTYEQLCMLTDRELKDIGINRNQIEAISRGWHPVHGFTR